ncbi:MAG TPA: carboxypeptidase regulatory-like domain-containing protein, partial [Acidobacteriota bacterium]|nr:carboxypeptidase regulatory-like domain-containing protein [Acidobacteriota bacterium]
GYNGATGDVTLSFGKATITGTVIDSTTSQPIQGASVYAKSKMDPTYGTSYAGYGSTDASGNYAIVVPGGSYQIVAEKTNYLQEVYDGILCGDGCNPTTGQAVTVSNGQQNNGINFSLELGGSVSGTVTDKETGAPLQAVNVYMDGVESAGGISSSKFATTDANGHYIVSRMAPGTYYPFIASAQGHEPQLYRDIPCTHCAKRTDGTPVYVAAGTSTTGIDFAVRKGTTVSGIVTDEVTGLPIANASVGIRGVTSVGTDATGHYSISGVPAGARVLRAGASQYAWELYDNVPCNWFSTCNTENGTMLNVPANTTLDGVNIALSPQGKITGTVIDAVTSQPIGSLKDLAIYDSTGKQLVLFGNGSSPYTFDSLAPGSYYVVAGATGHVTTLYNSVPCPGNSCYILGGTPIQVLKGQTTSGITLALQPAGSISGQVMSGGAPLPSALISVYNTDGDIVIDKIEADLFGNYKVDGLPAGDYFVEAFSGATSINKQYIPEVYNNVDCSACAPHAVGTAVTVNAGTETPGINFTLSQGGVIIGKVIGAIGGAPLAAKVSVFDSTGSLVSEARTDGSGQYATETGIVSGNYYVFAQSGAGYTAEMYNDIPCPNGTCNLFLGNQVSVTSGAVTPNINFGLADCADLSLGPSTLAQMTEGQSYSQQLAAAGGQLPYLYSLADGQLPTGLSLSDQGLVSGIPASGSFDFVIRAYDAKGCMRSAGYHVSVPKQPCLFCDDFEDGTPAPDWSYAKGLWAESGGSLTATPSGKTASAFATPAFGGCTQCSMETSMQTAGGSLNKMWFFAWYQDKNNVVEVLMKEESDRWIIRQRVNGVVVSKGKGVAAIHPGQFYVVHVNFTGSSFELSVDGNVLATIPAVSQPFGSVGYQVKNTVGSFGYVMVK